MTPLAIATRAYDGCVAHFTPETPSLHAWVSVRWPPAPYELVACVAVGPHASVCDWLLTDPRRTARGAPDSLRLRDAIARQACREVERHLGGRCMYATDDFAS